ncbi:MAG TPA: hypothetical protein VLJ13_03460 [Brevundimonas sp.]|nr:hypothetical protein [Brevundimonas sp.]
MRGAGLLVVACLGAGPISAQEPTPATHIQQMNRAARSSDDTEAGQVSAAAARLQPIPAAAAPDRLIGGSAGAARPTASLDQLSREGRTAEPASQLANREADPGPAPSAAQRAQGRVTTVTRPGGPDRCDPQSALRMAVVCDRVIEARAGEFSSPTFEPLSPEQRLLATEREQRRPASDPGSAARRLANGELDESNAALAVASMTLRSPPDEEKTAEPTAESSAIDAIVAGITTLVTGAPPTP